MSDETNGPITVEDFFEPVEGRQEEAQDNQEAAADEVEIGEDEVDAEPDTDDEADNEAEDEESPAPDAKMPHSWSKEDAKVWETMSSEQRAIVERREAERDKFVQTKAYEASQTRQQVESEAREIITQLFQNHSQQLEAWAQMFQASPPDQRLLYTNNPDDVLTYQRQEAAFRASADQQQRLHQQIAEAKKQAETVQSQAQQAALIADAQRLKDQFPEWFDPSEGPKLKSEFQSIGAELGYTPELMSEASSTDILALKVAHGWKVKAQKYDALMGKKMETVRAAKTLPKMTRPGAGQSKAAIGAATAEKRSQAMADFAQTRSGEAAAALLLERKR